MIDSLDSVGPTDSVEALTELSASYEVVIFHAVCFVP